MENKVQEIQAVPLPQLLLSKRKSPCTLCGSRFSNFFSLLAYFYDAHGIYPQVDSIAFASAYSPTQKLISRRAVLFGFK